MKPKRIQRKRTKGWKMPPNTVYVGRPTEWGNPYMLNCTKIRMGRTEIIVSSVEDAVKMYREDVMHRDCGFMRNHIRATLRGKDLACWCPLDQPCHADVLLEIANAGAGKSRLEREG